MQDSFYHYLLTQRSDDQADLVSIFAHNAALDHAFPKQSQNYHEITEYLELTAGYLPSMDVFDDAWQRYLDNC
ncbi:YozE family protein [Periweissella beninensis]|uniref:UPF0346 protein KAK10_02335 n=1 Tax=Periweissella beninensis TaxID=504936 RepID=A0ABT0VG37_9LACO|nr:YozE family protein [Periweissella beninensis]MBM7543849.1 uncharacterized protein YozE (UPF0346 family) [Periweissella beninensis]MCM2436770.1 YozE family protein [Periweissella beninensis]MCT4395522.1 YozE family protein [Periweissella beninensis]